MVIETKRLQLRGLSQGDFDALCEILQDEQVMYAYEHAFDKEEVQAWLDRQLWRQREQGLGLWAVVERESGRMIGQCGFSMQPYGNSQLLELGYLFQRAVWKRGFAIEAAKGCRDFAFSTWGVEAVYSMIRDNNLPSRRVAWRNGMTVVGQVVKTYHGIQMPHLLYSIQKTDWERARREP